LRWGDGRRLPWIGIARILQTLQRFAGLSPQSQAAGGAVALFAVIAALELDSFGVIAERIVLAYAFFNSSMHWRENENGPGGVRGRFVRDVYRGVIISSRYRWRASKRLPASW
jgi:hypothetical protein